jgi:hypothetical protein
MSQEKIYCANCQNCTVIKIPVSNKADNYLLRLKCLAGVWQKKLGTEKLYKYFTAARRTMEKCEHYTEMGELLPFIKTLRKTLPAQDEYYKAGKAPGLSSGEQVEGPAGADDADEE